MTDLKEGYLTKPYNGVVKRYCQTLDLKDQPELIAEYKNRHSPSCIWPEVCAGIREVGILNMEIYLLGNRLFMIVETPADFDWDKAFERLSGLPRQAEWEAYMAVFQQADPGKASNEKWQLMERIFQLPAGE